MKIMKVTSGGQISLPASIRQRWDAQEVLIEDHGDYAVVRPQPRDPVGAAYGALAEHFQDTSVDKVTREYREEGRAVEEQRWSKHRPS